MKLPSATTLLLIIVPMLACRAPAAIVNLSFTGTYDTGVWSVFGLSGNAVPFSFQITYDTSLNSNTDFYAAGSILNGMVTTHEWHGYSASGITATNLTFGSQTWTAGDLVRRMPEAGINADLWFDADISKATPTRSWIFFDDGNPDHGALELGDGTQDGVNIFMRQISSVSDHSHNGFSSLMTIASVPEPSGLMLLGGSMALGMMRRRRAV